MEYYEYNPQDNNELDGSDVKVKKKSVVSTSKLNIAKVYLWLALGLVLTGATSLGLPEIMVWVLRNQGEEAFSQFFLIALIVSICLMLPSVIIINVQSFRKNAPLMITSYVIYTLAMGALLGDIFLYVVPEGEGFETICVAFFVSALSFGIMGLIGSLMKDKSIGIVAPILSTLALGVLVISLVNFFIGSAVVYWVSDFIIFAIMLMVIAFDTHHVLKLADKVGFDNYTNLAIYCAYVLYVDFIWIFLKVLFYILIFRNRN